MFKKENLFTGYLVAGMLLGISGTLHAAGTIEDPKVLPVVLPKSAASVKTSGVSSVKPYAEGEVIVVMNESLSASEASTVLAQKKIKVLKEYKNLSNRSKSSYMLVSGDTSTEELVAQLKKDPNVKSVSPNYRRTISATTPNDPGFGDLWGLHNTGQVVNGTSGTADADIDAPEAWDSSTGSLDVVVAVFDTGVDYTHEDLSANMWVNPGEIPGNGIDDDSNGYIDDVYGYDFAGGTDGSNDPDPMDIMGHGTHVSGTIGAEANNGVGVSGVNWDVKIMAIKVFRPDLGAYDSDILEAVDYVLNMKNNYGVNIAAINASYGGLCGTNFQTDPMNDAIKSLGDAGIVFAAAAGNGGADGVGDDNDVTPECPASYDASNIIAVAATDQNDNLASFSNYGATSVDIAAPGTNILSTLPSFEMPDTTIFSDNVESGQGAWAASGSWAITTETANTPTHAWSDSPYGDYANNTDASLTYSTDIDLSGYTGQNIGLGACLKFDIEEGWDYLYIEASGDSGSNWTTLGSITGTQSTWGCGGVVIPDYLKTANFRMRLRLVTDVDVTRDGVYVDDIAIGAINPSNTYAYWAGTSMATPHVTGSVALMAAVFSGETVAERIDRILNGVDILPSLNGKVVTGGRLNIATSINLPGNHSPVAQNDTATTLEDSSVDIAVLANDSDADGDTLSISAVTSPANGTAIINGTQVTYTPDSDYSGSDSFSYTVSDGIGGTATATVSVTVTAVNDAPVAQNDTATVEVNSSVIIAVLSNDSDVDGDTLSISAVTSPANGTAIINGTQITYTPDINYTGSDSFTYTVSDGNGGTDTATVSVTVGADSGSGGGGGCTYNPHSKSIDAMMLLMMMMSLFYPLRRKYFK
ncbi:Ig-like domain-containing protein [Sulfurovum sp. ST-21]|uniref:Tandem-95 repeat protein n=1 Tax=Sulfurovum indicum TaxID=2779528 RepID=A0A7M1S2W5_9BACT|nr:Ig-like domain-containing protein [Sulfurovum indicum]QOR61544.1 tandem-95 repeat protein [Sulfurovum indicum]